MTNPLYLGDGVYVHEDSRGIVLTTGHHDPLRADNTIVLDPYVAVCLLNWIRKHNPNLIAS